ncbi:hypothetical protein RBU61_14145 [Tissierella sp. MB52-C2]|uniref:hypothetical protein n=1 Tax=Tissierella sp. MB52-C2 TaxID=3070999 RepID=UPI00280AAC7C|nr:hypothetical protein [Tissierella sp. MB52-C2]WMM24056.1 hypothetical protein RBU61_14145 [Tissierella sp. MB52-C2]
MNIPDKLVISGMEYKIKLEDKPLFCSNQRAYAHINYESKEISIDEGLQDTQGHQQSLLHEVIHGIVYDRELDFQNDGEETIVDQISKGLYQVIKDNPELFKA